MPLKITDVGATDEDILPRPANKHNKALIRTGT